MCVRHKSVFLLITLCHRCFHRGGRALGRRSGGRLRHDLLRNAAGGSCPSWRFGTGRSDGAREVPRAHGGAAGADSAALTAPTEERGPERPALPAVPLRAMPVAPRFRHEAVAAPACLPIRASLFSLVFYCPKRKSRSPTRCCFPSTRAGTGLQQEAAGSGLSDPGRRRPARHGSAGPLCPAPHRTAPLPRGLCRPGCAPPRPPPLAGPIPSWPAVRQLPAAASRAPGTAARAASTPPPPRNATPPARLTAGTEEEQQQRETGGAARRCHTAGRGALPRGRRARQQRRHRSCEGRGGADRRGGARSHGSRIGRPSRCRGRAGFLRRAGLAAGPPGFHRALRGVCRLSHPGRRGFLI